MACGYFRDLHKRKGSVKSLRDKAFNIVKNSKYYGYYTNLLQWFIMFFFHKKSSSDAVTRAWSETLVTIDKSDIKTKNMPNQHLAQANC